MAIPLESFIHSTRTVLGVLMVGLLRFVIITLRVFGGVANQLSKLLVFAYDVVITVPLSLEKLVIKGLRSRQQKPAEVTAQHNAEADLLLSEG